MKTKMKHEEIIASWQDGKSVVARIWRGRTKAERADDYVVILRKSLDEIAAKPGNLGVQMFRQENGDVTSFMVISYWPTVESMKSWAGSEARRIRALPEDSDFLLELPDYADLYDLQHNAWVTTPA